MLYSFNLMNHSILGQTSLLDVIQIMIHQLRELGHEAVWDPANDKLVTGDNRLNVIVEGFNPGIASILREYHAKGARYIILATEEPTEKGFNHGTQPEMVERQKAFPEVAALCEGIIHLVPGERVTRWYSQFAPAAPAELGYARALLRPSAVAPTYDFGFYGSLTKRRYRILKRLANMLGGPNRVRVVNDFAKQEERDAAMRQAKVILQIRKFEPMGLVSSSRCCTSICIGRPVLAEPHDLSKPWDEIVRFAPTEEAFYAEAMVARAAWVGMHEAQFAKFKAKMTPQRCIGDALERIGVLPERRAA